MKIYNIFNSGKELLSSFTNEVELFSYIRRHKRDDLDTTVLVTEADGWNEFGGPRDVTKEVMSNAWKELQ